MTSLRGWTLTVPAQASMVTETCHVCGLLFALEDGFRTRRLKDGRTFYCPNGHSEAYIQGKTPEQKLKDAETRNVALNDQLRAAIRDAESSRSELLRIRARIANGVCPCCNRSFGNVRAHMQTQHPDFTVDVPKGADVTFRCSCGTSFHTFKGLRIHQGKSRGDEWDQPDARRWSSHLTVV